MIRSRGIRIFVLISIIVAIGITTLSYQEIHIGSLDRTNKGPLGLALGLDLEGGSHLVYQAYLPDQVELRLQEEVAEDDIQVILDELDQTAEITKKQYILGDLGLANRALNELHYRLSRDVGEVEQWSVAKDSVKTSFKGVADVDVMRGILDDLGYGASTIFGEGDSAFSISGLTLEKRGLQNLSRTLENGLGAIDSFEIVGDQIEVTFRDIVGNKELRDLIVESGTNDPTIENPPQSYYLIRGMTLTEESDQTFRQELEARFNLIPEQGYQSYLTDADEEQMKGVVDIISRRVNALGTTEPIIQKLGQDRVVVQLPGGTGTTINILFQKTPTLPDLEFALGQLGKGQAQIDPGNLNDFVVTTSLPMTETEKQDFENNLSNILGPLITFQERQDDNEIQVQLPTNPSELLINEIIKNIGLGDTKVQQQPGLGSFVVNSKLALDTSMQQELREALESSIGPLISFDPKGGIEEAKRLIGQTAQLVFKERRCLSSLDEVKANPRSCEPLENGGLARLVDQDIGLTGEDLDRAFIDRDTVTNEWMVSVSFNSRGADIFSDLTTRLSGNELGRIAIFLDGHQISAPVVQSPIRNGQGVIRGGFTRMTASNLAIQLESGRLPVPLTLIRENTVDALLGSDSLSKSLKAGFVGLGLVLLFMLLYYRLPGLVSAIALMVYGIILLSIFKLIPVTLTLSGMAGIVLSIGMAVDANVLIFERMKEELRTGRSLNSAIEIGFRRAWNAIRDGNVSTALTCIILWWFGDRLGAPIVTGFALTLLIGVLVSMFTAMTVSRHLLQLIALTPLGRGLKLFTPEPPRRRNLGVIEGEE